MSDSMHDSGQDVRDWLHSAGRGADAALSSFDAGGTIRRALGRRRRTRFAMAGTAAVAAAAVLGVPVLLGHPTGPSHPVPGVEGSASAPATRVVDCAMTELPVPGGLAARGVTQPPRVYVTAMDPSGAYVVGSAFAADNNAGAVILWHNGVATVLPENGPGTIAGAAAVNSHGVVAGTGERPGAIGFAWVYRNGVTTRLANVPGYTRLVQVYAVDEAGDVLGSALSTSGEHSVVVVWPAAAPGEPRIQAGLTDQLGTLIGAAFGDDGRIYGWSAADTTPAVMTGDGRKHALPLPDGFAVGGVTGVHGSWVFGSVSSELPSPARTAKRAVTTPAPVTATVRWKLDGGPAVVVDGTAMESLDALPPTFVTTRIAGRAALGYVALDGDFAGRVFALPAGDDAPRPVAISRDASSIAGAVGPVGDNESAGHTRPALWHC
ncbi:hypothetical protein [Hamadaea tsunoensis]|uniref:hypothetical protein n=1 Tax=Hamadaea tsunoensis TaxID=53368 RepID=UPI000400F19E|nr:hypothetical protein [Hamadaea tsunoensis]